VGKSLTLNLGLAYAMVTPISEAHDRIADFDPTNGQFLIAGQNAGSSAGIKMDWTALEPRVGAAWKPFGNSTVFRGGYAIFHDSSWNQGAQGLWQNPPYYAETHQPFGTPMSAGFVDLTSPPNPADFQGTLWSQPTDFKQGRIQQFNFDVEQQIPGNIVLTAGYAGSRSSHILESGESINVGSPAACGTVSGYTLGCGPGGAAFAAPYPAFPGAEINSIFDVGRAHYNSLQIKAETKSAKYGIYALVGYTYSRSYDTGFSDGVATVIGATYFPLPNWQKLDWGLSQMNLNNNFTASIVYDLPFGKGRKWGSNWNAAGNAILGGWEVTVIEHATSGFPIFDVDSNAPGVSLLNSNDATLIRPNMTCNPALSHPTLAEWFNASCFSQPASGELGNGPRTLPVAGPRFTNTDFSIIKHFVPREGWRVDFRAEFFNLFNHPQFGAPGYTGSGADFNTPQFAVINYTVNNPRLVQFGLKLAF
jgi:hypothetical protein